MRKILVLVMAVVLVGAFSYASASETTKHAKSSGMEATIQSVDFAKDTIVVQIDNSTKTLRFNGDTQFRSAGKERSVTLKAGDKVLVWLDNRNKDVLKKLELLAPSEAGSAAAASHQ